MNMGIRVGRAMRGVIMIMRKGRVLLGREGGKGGEGMRMRRRRVRRKGRVQPRRRWR